MQTMTELGGHDLHLSVRQRALIVNAVLVEGKSYRAVARELGLHHKTVSNTINKFNESHDLHEHPSGGRPSAYDDDDLYRLECLIDQEPSATAERLVELMGPEAPAADVTTIRRYRRVLGYTRRKPAIWEIDTERSARLRDVWLLEQKHSNPQRWVYMDESTLCLRDTGEYVWIKSGKRTPKHEIEHLRCSINVWEQCGKEAPHSASTKAISLGLPTATSSTSTFFHTRVSSSAVTSCTTQHPRTWRTR